jgi:hypothetical protein
MTTLNLKAAFFHVIDAHRWLAASGCTWNLVGVSAVNGPKEEACQMLPNVDVMVLDSLLLHARLLIDFYVKQCQSGSTDILLCDFGISIDQGRSNKLATYKHPIEVHLLHLADFRDYDYRTLHPTGRGATRGRPDWNQEAIPIVNLILDALKYASDQEGDWQRPFRDLHDAANMRYREKSYVWPNDLREKPDVEQYLKALGL